MRNSGYMIKRIFKLDYANMFKIAKKVSKKSSKSYIGTIFDMIHCGLKFEAGYYDYQEFEFYNLTEDERKTYLTRGKNNEIIKKFNNPDFFHLIDNKDEFYSSYKEYIKREWIKVFDSSEDEFIEFFKNQKQIICKPFDGEGGKGIKKFEFTNIEDAKKIYQELTSDGKYLAEEVIIQHEKLNELYPNSINSMRMFTFNNGIETFFLYALLKLGNGGVVDNFSSGGMYSFLDENGKVITGALDRDDNIYLEHPMTHKKLIGFEVPEFKEATELVKNAAKNIPEVRIYRMGCCYFKRQRSNNY